MAVWNLVKDLNIKISEETAVKVIVNLKAEDWEQVKKDLQESIKDNEKAANTLALVLKLIDIIKTTTIKLAV